MGWTEERVELLKKLWMEGLSASQIAGELGEGVTRNAVIGKVHRLKLSARAKPTSAPPRARAPQRPAPRRIGTPSGGGGMGVAGIGTPSGGGMGASLGLGGATAKARPTTMRPQTIGATALALTPELHAEIEIAPQAQELFIPEEKRLTLLQLNEHTCKWPIGDPLTKDFHFCGQHSLESGPYCEFHARRAYHQVDKRKR